LGVLEQPRGLPSGLPSHSRSFSNALSIVRDALRDLLVFEDGRMDAPLLLLGLIFREVSRSIEIEPGAPTLYPQKLVHLPFGIGKMNEIEEMLDSVVLP
jgi:hypothetical protein